MQKAVQVSISSAELDVEVNEKTRQECIHIANETYIDKLVFARNKTSKIAFKWHLDS